jgi:hypothetical protein
MVYLTECTRLMADLGLMKEFRTTGRTGEIGEDEK